MKHTREYGSFWPTYCARTHILRSVTEMNRSLQLISFQLFHDEGCYHIETSPLICVMKELTNKKKVLYWNEMISQKEIINETKKYKEINREQVTQKCISYFLHISKQRHIWHSFKCVWRSFFTKIVNEF